MLCLHTRSTVALLERWNQEKYFCEGWRKKSWLAKFIEREIVVSLRTKVAVIASSVRMPTTALFRSSEFLLVLFENLALSTETAKVQQIRIYWAWSLRLGEKIALKEIVRPALWWARNLCGNHFWILGSLNTRRGFSQILRQFVEESSPAAINAGRSRMLRLRECENCVPLHPHRLSERFRQLCQICQCWAFFFGRKLGQIWWILKWLTDWKADGFDEDTWTIFFNRLDYNVGTLLNFIHMNLKIWGHHSPSKNLHMSSRSFSVFKAHIPPDQT